MVCTLVRHRPFEFSRAAVLHYDGQGASLRAAFFFDLRAGAFAALFPFPHV